MHPPNTPQTTVSLYKIISKNTRLAELRLFLLAPLNMLQAPIKLVLNRAFQVGINKIARLRRAMMLLRSLCLWQRRRFGLTAPCVEEKMSEYGDPLSLQVQKVTADCSGSVGVEIKQNVDRLGQERTPRMTTSTSR